MIFRLRAAAVLFSVLVCGLYGVRESAAQPQITALDARVVIIDASGSMSQRSYPNGEGSRWNEAMALAEEYFSQLEERGDAVPTEVMIFGSETSFLETLAREQRKPNAQQQFSNSQEYPINGALCSDLRFVTSDFAAPSEQTFQTLRRYISSLPGGAPRGGMTPQGPAINMAIQRLIAKYGAGVKAQIVSFSDFEAFNCAPPELSVCEQILPSLNLLNRNGGRAEMRILEIPDSTLVEELFKCAPSKTVVHDPGGSTPKKTVEELLDEVNVVATARSTTPGLLNAGMIDLGGMSLQVFRPGKTVVIAGGPADAVIPIEPGRYDFVLSNGAQQWRVTQDVQQDQQIVFDVAAGRVKLSATRNGSPLSQLSSVEIRDSKGGIAAPAGGTATPAEFVLMAGQYELIAQDRGQTRRLPVTVSFGGSTPVDVTFSEAAANPRPVTVAVDIRQPTVDVVAFNPAVQLSGGGIAPVTLSNTLNSLNLAPGVYDVSVGGIRKHNLTLTVPPGTGEVAVRVVVTPGWFEAIAPMRGGTFELLDASGKVIATFLGNTVRHSLADGTYRLAHIGDDNQRREVSMRINAGDFTDVRF